MPAKLLVEKGGTLREETMIHERPCVAKMTLCAAYPVPPAVFPLADLPGDIAADRRHYAEVARCDSR